MSVLSQRLRLLREACGETQSEVAHALNTTQDAVWGWESERRRPDWRQLGKLALHFRVSVDYLVGNTADPTPHPAAPERVLPQLTRWLRDALTKKGARLDEVARATRVPMSKLSEIMEGTVIFASPLHLRRLAEFFGDDPDSIESLAPQQQPPEEGAGVTGVAALSSQPLSEEEQRLVDAFIRQLREQRQKEKP